MSDNKIDEEHKLSKKLDQIVANIGKRNKFIKSKVEKRRINTKGGSYLGIPYEIYIKATTNNGDIEENIFVKNILTRNEPILSVSEVYKKELFAYRDILKKIDKVQSEANVPVEERYKIPKFYEESDEEAIVLENLSIQGFKTYYRTEVINIEFAKLAVKALAKFHAISYVIKLKEPNYFKTNIKGLRNLVLNEYWYDFSTKIAINSINFLKSDVKEKYGKAILKIVTKHPDHKLDDERNIRTLCHGDYRFNNIMVKEINGVPSQVIPVDYQTIHFGDPIIDFFYFIFFGTDREFRKRHMNCLKELYYENLTIFLDYFNLNVEDVFPRSEFEREYKEKMEFGILVGATFWPITFSVEGKIPDLSNPGDIAHCEMVPEFKDRFRELVEDFIDWEVLDKYS